MRTRGTQAKNLVFATGDDGRSGRALVRVQRVRDPGEQVCWAAIADSVPALRVSVESGAAGLVTCSGCAIAKEHGIAAAGTGH